MRMGRNLKLHHNGAAHFQAWGQQMHYVVIVIDTPMEVITTVFATKIVRRRQTVSSVAATTDMVLDLP